VARSALRRRNRHRDLRVSPRRTAPEPAPERLADPAV